jgi:hypothetical protein
MTTLSIPRPLRDSPADLPPPALWLLASNLLARHVVGLSLLAPTPSCQRGTSNPPFLQSSPASMTQWCIRQVP